MRFGAQSDTLDGLEDWTAHLIHQPRLSYAGELGHDYTYGVNQLATAVVSGLL